MSPSGKLLFRELVPVDARWLRQTPLHTDGPSMGFAAGRVTVRVSERRLNGLVPAPDLLVGVQMMSTGTS